MQTDPVGRPYLLGGDPVSEIAQYTDAVRPLLPGDDGQPWRQAAGYFELTMDDSGYRQSGDIDFPAGRFTVPPIVIITPRVGGPAGAYIAEAVDLSASSFQARVLRVVGTWTGTASMNWHAIQMTPGTAGDMEA